MWELSDPAIPTHRKGSASDKILLLPGTNIPDEWLPEQSHDWFEGVDGVLSSEEGTVR